MHLNKVPKVCHGLLFFTVPWCICDRMKGTNGLIPPSHAELSPGKIKAGHWVFSHINGVNVPVLAHSMPQGRNFQMV